MVGLRFFTNFMIFFYFESRLREFERLKLLSLIKLLTIFYDFSVSRNQLSKLKSREICDIRAFYFLNGGSTCDMTDVPAFINDRKTTAGPFGAIHDIPRCLSLA